MLTIHEWAMDDGTRGTVALAVEEGELVMHVTAEPPVALPILVLDRVMNRYAKPIADSVAREGPTLDLGEGRTLQRIRHLAQFDVIARDFLVWSVPGREPMVELAVAVSGALTHVAKGARTT